MEELDHRATMEDEKPSLGACDAAEGSTNKYIDDENSSGFLGGKTIDGSNIDGNVNSVQSTTNSIDSGIVLNDDVENNCNDDLPLKDAPPKDSQVQMVGEIPESEQRKNLQSPCPPKRVLFQFQVLPHHVTGGTKSGRQYKCEVCATQYRHAFSLKRHFLRNHVNYDFISETDVLNCGINIKKYNQQVFNSLAKETDKTASTHEPTEPTFKPEVGSQNYSKTVDDFSCVNSKSPMSVLDVGKHNVFRCSICFQLYDLIDDLISHQHQHSESSTDEKKFACSKCNMKFSRNQNYIRHLALHSGVLPYKCSQCGAAFSTSQNLGQHEHHHVTGKHQCDQCSLVLDSINDLEDHMNREHPDKFHACSFCRCRFAQGSTFEIHLGMHNESLESNQIAAQSKKTKRPKDEEVAISTCSDNKSDDNFNNIMAFMSPNQVHSPDFKISNLSANNAAKFDTDIVDRRLFREEDKIDYDDEENNSDDDVRMTEKELLLKQHKKFSVGKHHRWRRGLAFECPMCKKRFRDYARMCAHRRLAHQRHLMQRRRGYMSNKPEMDPRERKKLEEFYASVANNVSENLCTYIDGKEPSLVNPYRVYRFEYHPVIKRSLKGTEFWELFNFSSDYPQHMRDIFFDAETDNSSADLISSKVHSIKREHCVDSVSCDENEKNNNDCDKVQSQSLNDNRAVQNDVLELENAHETTVKEGNNGEALPKSETTGDVCRLNFDQIVKKEPVDRAENPVSLEEQQMLCNVRNNVNSEKIWIDNIHVSDISSDDDDDCDRDVHISDVSLEYISKLNKLTADYMNLHDKKLNLTSHHKFGSSLYSNSASGVTNESIFPAIKKSDLTTNLVQTDFDLSDISDDERPLANSKCQESLSQKSLSDNMIQSKDDEKENKSTLPILEYHVSDISDDEIDNGNDMYQKHNAIGSNSTKLLDSPFQMKKSSYSLNVLNTNIPAQHFGFMSENNQATPMPMKTILDYSSLYASSEYQSSRTMHCDKIMKTDSIQNVAENNTNIVFDHNCVDKKLTATNPDLISNTARECDRSIIDRYLNNCVANKNMFTFEKERSYSIDTVSSETHYSDDDEDDDYNDKTSVDDCDDDVNSSEFSNGYKKLCIESVGAVSDKEMIFDIEADETIFDIDLPTNASTFICNNVSKSEENLPEEQPSSLCKGGFDSSAVNSSSNDTKYKTSSRISVISPLVLNKSDDAQDEKQVFTRVYDFHEPSVKDVLDDDNFSTCSEERKYRQLACLNLVRKSKCDKTKNGDNGSLSGDTMSSISPIGDKNIVLPHITKMYLSLQSKLISDKTKPTPCTEPLEQKVPDPINAVRHLLHYQGLGSINSPVISQSIGSHIAGDMESIVMPPLRYIYDDYDIEVVYMCLVCKAEYNNVWDLGDHELEEHATVDCRHIEMERSSCLDLCSYVMPKPSTDGILASITNNFPLEPYVDCLKCTKCREKIASKDDMHSHIMYCAIDGKTRYNSKLYYYRHGRGYRRGRNKLGRRVRPGPKMKKVSYETLARRQSLIASIKFEGDAGKKDASAAMGVMKPRRPRKMNQQMPYNPSLHVRRRNLRECIDKETCWGCGKKFDGLALLERHSKGCDQKHVVQQRKLLQQDDTIKTEVVSPTPQSEEPKPEIKKDMLLQCPYCSKNFMYRTHLRTHLREVCAVKKRLLSQDMLLAKDVDAENRLLNQLFGEADIQNGALSEADAVTQAKKVMEQGRQKRKLWMQGYKRKVRKKHKNVWPCFDRLKSTTQKPSFTVEKISTYLGSREQLSHSNNPELQKDDIYAYPESTDGEESLGSLHVQTDMKLVGINAETDEMLKKKAKRLKPVEDNDPYYMKTVDTANAKPNEHFRKSEPVGSGKRLRKRTFKALMLANGMYPEMDGRKCRNIMKRKNSNSVPISPPVDEYPDVKKEKKDASNCTDRFVYSLPDKSGAVKVWKRRGPKPKWLKRMEADKMSDAAQDTVKEAACQISASITLNVHDNSGNANPAEVENKQGLQEITETIKLDDKAPGSEEMVCSPVKHDKSKIVVMNEVSYKAEKIVEIKPKPLKLRMKRKAQGKWRRQHQIKVKENAEIGNDCYLYLETPAEKEPVISHEEFEKIDHDVMKEAVKLKIIKNVKLAVDETSIFRDNVSADLNGEKVLCSEETEQASKLKKPPVRKKKKKLKLNEESLKALYDLLSELGFDEIDKKYEEIKLRSKKAGPKPKWMREVMNIYRERRFGLPAVAPTSVGGLSSVKVSSISLNHEEKPLDSSVVLPKVRKKRKPRKNRLKELAEAAKNAVTEKIRLNQNNSSNLSTEAMDADSDKLVIVTKPKKQAKTVKTKKSASKMNPNLLFENAGSNVLNVTAGKTPIKVRKKPGPKPGFKRKKKITEVPQLSSPCKNNCNDTEKSVISTSDVYDFQDESFINSVQSFGKLSPSKFPASQKSKNSSASSKLSSGHIVKELNAECISSPEEPSLRVNFSPQKLYTPPDRVLLPAITSVPTLEESSPRKPVPCRSLCEVPMPGSCDSSKDSSYLACGLVEQDGLLIETVQTHLPSMSSMSCDS